MTDEKIVKLFFERSERALSETERSYGRYFRSIAFGILHNNEDAEEIVNDTYMKAWNVIPPEKPRNLKAFIGTMTRQLSINRLKSNNAKKRGEGTKPAQFEELSECIGAESEDPIVESQGLSEAISLFLHSVSLQSRRFFIRRYWHMQPIIQIAKDCRVSESKVKSSLMRTRAKLKEFLKKEGFNI